jgi:hypothetical protein
MTSHISRRALAAVVVSLATLGAAPALAAPSAASASGATPSGPTRTASARVSKKKAEPARAPDSWRLQMRMSRGRLGVQVLEITPELRRHYGASAGAGLLIGRVEPASAAERAGIVVGDLLVSVAGKPVQSSWDVLRALTGKRKGETVPVVLLRNKKRTALRVTLEREGLGGWSWSTRGEAALSGELGDFDFDLEVPGFPGLGRWLERLNPGAGAAPPYVGRGGTLEGRVKKLEKRLRRLERRRGSAHRSGARRPGARQPAARQPAVPGKRRSPRKRPASERGF